MSIKSTISIQSSLEATLRSYQQQINQDNVVFAQLGSMLEKVAQYPILGISYWQSLIQLIIHEKIDTTKHDNDVGDEKPDDEKGDGVLNLYVLALRSCPHESLVRDMIEYIIKKYDDEELDEQISRQFFNLALQISGSDILSGSSIFAKFLQFEMDEHEDLVEIQSSAESILESKQRIIKLIHRQLGLPLLGNEKALKDIEIILGEIFTETDVSLIQPEKLLKNYQLGIEKRLSRLLFEEFLISSKYEAASDQVKYDSWNAYIQFELKEKELSRVERLYQRAVIDVPSHYGLWVQYIEFLVFTVSNLSSALDVAEKAVLMFTNDPFFWTIRLLAMDSCGVDIERISSTAQQAAYSGLSNLEDYLNMILFPCEALARRMRKGVSNADAYRSMSKTLSETFDSIEATLQSYYPDWLQAHLRVCKFRVHQEYLNVPVEDEGISVATVTTKSGKPKLAKAATWERIVTQNPKTYSIWVEYVAWANSRRDHNLSRSIFRRAIHSVTDYNSEICKDWVNFESSFGEISDILAALEKTRQLNQTRQIAPTVVSVASTSLSSTTYDEKVSMESHAVATDKPAKRKVQFDEVKAEDTMVVGDGNLVQAEGPSHKKSKSNAAEQSHPAQTEIANPADIDVSSTSVMVSNLPFSFSATAVSDCLHAVLSSSRAKDCEIELQLAKSGRSKGMALLHCGSNNVATEVFGLLNGYLVNGRPLAAKLTSDQPSEASSHHPSTIFVSKLPLSLTSEELRALFARFGEIVCAKVTLDKTSGQSKGHGLVQFATEDAKQAAFCMNRHQVGEQLISVLPSKYAALVVESVKESISSAPTDSKDKISTEMTRIVPVPSDVDVATNPYLADNHSQQQMKKEIKSSSTLMFKPRKLKI